MRPLRGPDSEPGLAAELPVDRDLLTVTPKGTLQVADGVAQIAYCEYPASGHVVRWRHRTGRPASPLIAQQVQH